MITIMITYHVLRLRLNDDYISTITISKNYIAKIAIAKSKQEK